MFDDLDEETRSTYAAEAEERAKEFRARRAVFIAKWVTVRSRRGQVLTTAQPAEERLPEPQVVYDQERELRQ